MTADPTLSARLAAASMRYDATETGYALDDLRGLVFGAWQSGQLITLADHESAVKAAVDAREDEILDMIDTKFSGALHLRDEARKAKDTQGAAIHNEAVQTLADMRSAIRARANGGE